MKKESIKQPDHHVRTWLRLDPRRLGGHSHLGVSQLEQGLNFGLLHEKYNFVLENMFLVDDPGHIFEFLDELFIEALLQNLVLQAESGNFLEHIPGTVLEVDAVELVVEFEDDLIVEQLIIHVELVEVHHCQLSDLDVVELHQLIHDLNVLGDVLDHPVLGVDQHVSAGVDDSLYPQIHFSLLCFKQVVFVRGFQSVVSVQNVETVDEFKLGRDEGFVLFDFPQGVDPAVVGGPL